MQKVIMWIMALGAVAGGVDHIFGDRMGLGKKFENGFMLLGPTALSMAGIICLAPLLSGVLGPLVSPLFARFGLDPAMLGSLLAIDMGGYQMAMELCADKQVGLFSGLIAGAVFGCTITFTIPVGVGMIESEDQQRFARGILLGLIAMPAALVAGGVCCGLSLGTTLFQSLPILLLCGLFLLGLIKIPHRMIHGFSIFALVIRTLTFVGLILGAFQYMTGVALVPGLAPLEDAMAVVASIGIVLLGSLPVAELLQRLLHRPFAWFGQKIGVNETSVAGLLISMVSVVPVFTMIKDMDTRGKVINVAFMVSATAMLAAHLGFTAGVAPDLIPALLVAKLSGSIAALGVALIATRKDRGV